MKRNSYNKIAEQVGISAPQLSRIRTGKRNASPTVAERLAKETKSSLRVWLFSTEKTIAERQKLLERMIEAGS